MLEEEAAALHIVQKMFWDFIHPLPENVKWKTKCTVVSRPSGRASLEVGRRWAQRIDSWWGFERSTKWHPMTISLTRNLQTSTIQSYPWPTGEPRSPTPHLGIPPPRLTYRDPTARWAFHTTTKHHGNEFIKRINAKKAYTNNNNINEMQLPSREKMRTKKLTIY